MPHRARAAYKPLAVNGNATVPEGENLRRAVRWLSEHGPLTRETINEAGLRFDLTPLEEEFLLREFLHRNGPDSG